MRKILYFSFFLCLLVSCNSSNEPIDMNLIGTSGDASSIEPEDSLDIREFISSHEMRFGSHVLVLDSLQEAYDLMYQYKNADIEELREMYHARNYYNHSIESHLYYDSLMSAYYNDIAGVDYTEENVDAHPEVLEALSINLEDFPTDMINLHEISFNGETTLIAEPYGELGWDALTNEKGLFVIGDRVHRFMDDEHVVFPIELYTNNEFETIESVKNYIMSAGNDPCEDGSDDEPIYDLPVVYYYDHYRDQYLTHHAYDEIFNGDRKYKMTLELDACADYCKFYGSTYMYIDLSIKNYKVGSLGLVYWLTKFYTDGYCSCLYEAYMDSNPHDLQTSVMTYIGLEKAHISVRRPIANFADHSFPNPHCGLIDFSYHIDNGRVTLER